MNISDLYTREVMHIRPQRSVQEAAETMRRCHVGALVVTERPNGEDVPIGIVTDRDIAIAVVAAGVDPAAVTVNDVMTRNVVTCTERQDLFDALASMHRHGVRRLPVVNAHGGLVGMFTADDAFGVLGEMMRELSRALTREQVREMEQRG
jgi:CBS domain-containing protein